LFLGQHQELHRADQYAPWLQQTVAPEGINLTYTVDPNDLNPATLARYDALIIYANHQQMTTSQERALLEFVSSGKGLVAIHSASACFLNSDAYVKLIGGQIRTHGSGVFTPEIVVPAHPVFDGVKPYTTWDESYVHTKLSADRIVLMEHVDSSGREPWTWVRTQGKGRVFYTASGHDQHTWSDPNFLHLLRNAILWTVGDDVRKQWEELALPPLRYRDVSGAPIPNYENRNPAPRFQEPLSATDALKHLQVPPGFDVQLFASEPQITNPIAMAWDERGRLWVLESADYPNSKAPRGDGHDDIKILEDTNGDGRADKVTVFADHLSIPTSLTFANGGVIVAQAPDFLFLKDTTGDDRADIRQTIMTGWGIEDTHFGPSNLRYGFDNMLWGAVGAADFDGTVGGTHYNFGRGYYRFSADGQRFEPISTLTNNLWGLGFTEAFDVFGSSANNEHSVYVGIPNRDYAGAPGLTLNGFKKIDGHYAVHPNTAKIRQVDVQGGFTAATGHSFYTARSFPKEYWNHVAFVNEPTAHVVHRAIIDRDGTGFAESDGWNILASDDEWFTPIQSDVGPDGALWVLDWCHFIIQHSPAPPGFKRGEYGAYETPLRNSHCGRVYRVVWKGSPTTSAPTFPRALHRDRPTELLAALRSDNLFWRLTAQRLLVERGHTDVVDSLMAMASDRSMDSLGLNPTVLHALWTMHGLGVVNDAHPFMLAVARRALTHPSAAVRKNALMLLPQTDATLQEVLRLGLLNDPDLQVRLQTLLTLSEFPASLPSSNAAGRAIYRMSVDSGVVADEWLSEAVALAAARHSAGFFAAYADDIGLIPFLRVAVLAQRGELENFTNLSSPSLNDSSWSTRQLPTSLDDTTEAINVSGTAWFRKAVDIPSESFFRGRGPVILRLGPLAQNDITYVNGTRVAWSTNVDFWAPMEDRVREYQIPPELLREGRNVIAVRLSSMFGRGGIFADSTGMKLMNDSTSISIAGEWKFAVEQRHQTFERWRQIVSSAPIAQQLLGLSNPLDALSKPSTASTPLSRQAREAALRSRAGVSAAVPAVLPNGLDTARLAVRVIEPMQFDRSLLTVKAGQPIRLTFANATSDGSHNFVLFANVPMARIEKLLLAGVNNPAAQRRGFVPLSKLVLQASPLLQAKQSVTLRFHAPATPGDYPFVCTFPGHWTMMRGMLRVAGSAVGAPMRR